jgi:hypothetical protein
VRSNSTQSEHPLMRLQMRLSMRWPRREVAVTSLGVLTAVFHASAAAAQGHPDFSGRWTSGPPPAVPSARDAAANSSPQSPPSADLGSGWGRTITIAQDARTITIEWPIFSAYDMQPPLRFVYALDGSESVNAVMMGRGTQRQRSRTRWAGDSLVITTTHPFTDPATGRAVPTEIRQTLVLESPTSLVVQTARPGASGAAPATSRTVYTKGGGT